jgi:hypothetical protein
MIGVLKRRWWLGPLVASFAIAASVIVQATITIASGILHAANTKPLTSQEPRLNPLPSFRECMRRSEAPRRPRFPSDLAFTRRAIVHLR